MPRPRAEQAAHLWHFDRCLFGLHWLCLYGDCVGRVSGNHGLYLKLNSIRLGSNSLFLSSILLIIIILVQSRAISRRRPIPSSSRSCRLPCNSTRWQSTLISVRDSHCASKSILSTLRILNYMHVFLCVSYDCHAQNGRTSSMDSSNCKTRWPLSDNRCVYFPPLLLYFAILLPILICIQRSCIDCCRSCPSTV